MSRSISREVLASLVDRMPAGVSVHHPDLSVLWINERLSLIIGVNRDLAIGSRFGTMFGAGAEVDALLSTVHDQDRSIESSLIIPDPDTGGQRRYALTGFPLDEGDRLIGLVVSETLELGEERSRLASLKDASDAFAVAGTLQELEEALVREATMVPETVATHLITADPETNQIRFVQRVGSGFERLDIDPDDHAAMLAPHRLNRWVSLPRHEFVVRFGRPDWLLPATAHVVAGPLRTDQLIVGTLMWQLAAPEDHVSRATMRSYSASAAAAVEAIRRPELDRRLARTYQESLLPPELPDVGDLELVGRYRSAMAADRSGGDWYDVVPQRDGANVLIVGDAVGHGIDAAVSMGHVRDVTRAAALELTAPSAILKRVDRYLDELDDGTMAAMTIVVVSPSGDHFSIATAANPGPFLRRPTGTVESIDSPAGPFVGSGLDPEYEEQRHRFEPGAALILVTDGVVQRKGGSIDDGERAAREALTAPFIDLDDLCTRLIDGNGAESGHDDMVVLAALRTV